MEFPVKLTLELESIHIARQALREMAKEFKAESTRDYVARILAVEESLFQATQDWIKGENQ